MKIRDGFVSNSSTTSFTCQHCNERAMGRDLSIEDAEMRECQKGHTFCESYLLGEPGPDEEDEDSDYRYYTDPARCPICNMIGLSPKDETTYLRKKAGFKTRTDVLAAVKQEFSDYESFNKWLKE